MKYKSLIDHPIWSELKKHIDIENNNAPGGWRINILDTIPVRIARKAMRAKVMCSGTNCNKEILPIRQGNGWGYLYFSSTCPQEQTTRCSRTRGAILGCKKVRDASIL